MFTPPQIWLLKSAQRQAGIADEEYRETLQRLCGVTTSKDPSLGDDHLDILLSYFEAIYWRGVDSKELQPPCKRSEPFQQRGYWASKNQRGNTSRDRYHAEGLNEEIDTLERALAMEFKCSLRYFEAIKLKVIPRSSGSMTRPAGLVKYKAALARTLAAKRRKAALPF